MYSQRAWPCPGDRSDTCASYVQDILTSHLDNTTEAQSAVVILLNLVAQVLYCPGGHQLCIPGLTALWLAVATVCLWSGLQYTIPRHLGSTSPSYAACISSNSVPDAVSSQEVMQWAGTSGTL